MKKIVKIHVTINASCVMYYKVELKKDYENNFVELPTQDSAPITIENLDEFQNYNVRVTAICCNGQPSNSEIVNFTT